MCIKKPHNFMTTSYFDHPAHSHSDRQSKRGESHYSEYLFSTVNEDFTYLYVIVFVINELLLAR